MARATITATAIAATGLNITDATFATLGTGAGNGVSDFVKRATSAG